MPPQPPKKYNIIYADPPWDGLGWNNGSGKKAPANHYTVQSIEWIKSLNISNITGEFCFLFLWVTFPNLQEGLDVIHAWGFKYATCGFTWIKENKKPPKTIFDNPTFMGCGNYTRANSELCLLGTKGKCQTKVKDKSVRQVCISPIQRHSRKPDEIRNRILRLCGDLPRIELFARNQTPGWDSWGNEVKNSINLTTRK